MSVAFWGTFYMLVLVVVRGYKLGLDGDVSKRESRRFRTFILFMHCLAFLILSLPGIVLLLSKGGLLAASGFGASALGFAVVDIIVRGVRHRRGIANLHRLVIAEAFFWLYVLQLAGAGVLRAFPITIRDENTDGQTQRKVERAWKGSSPSDNVIPVVGIWWMLEPDAYYVEEKSPDGKKRYGRILYPNPYKPSK